MMTTTRRARAVSHVHRTAHRDTIDVTMTKPYSRPEMTATSLDESEVELDFEFDGLSGTDVDRADFDGEQLDLADRQALRRVAGLSTELADVTEVEYRQLRLERVVLVGVWTNGTAVEAENSLAELAALAETAGSQVLEGVVQRRERPDTSTYIGSGKARELRDIVLATGADTVICDGELTPAQLTALEKVVKVKVIDRTALILDIFAQHARSKEGKAQVALAQMQYMLPRLRGWGESMSRQAGGRAGGSGGGGGTRERMAKLRRELNGMKKIRDTMRQERMRNEVPSVAIAGYTNAGKSSLLNRITGAGVLVEDALFATLDPTVRRARTSDNRDYTLSDTVGFVRHLPHQLIEAFRSTLEEISHSDLILHVVDGSDADPIAQVNAVHEVLAEIDAAKVTELVVVNKVDAAPAETLLRLRRALPGAIFVSARTGEGIDELRAEIERLIPRPTVELRVCVPYDRGGLVSRVHDEGALLDEEHTADGTALHARVSAALAAELEPYARHW